MRHDVELQERMPWKIDRFLEGAESALQMWNGLHICFITSLQALRPYGLSSRTFPAHPIPRSMVCSLYKGQSSGSLPSH